MWNPSVGQVLRLRKEPDNSHDRHAVAVVKSGDTVVGHVPYNLAPLFSHFLAREFNDEGSTLLGKGLIEALDTDSKSHAFIIYTA